jgi:hypothetical protein
MLVYRCLVVPGMASRAGNGGRGISRVAIADRFTVLIVTGKAGQVNRVVAWVITRRRMGKTGWSPSRRDMAGITILGSHEVVPKW